MAVYFQLFKRGEISDTGVALPAIDDELREFFNQPPSEDDWLSGWYDSIGFRLALGKTWEEIKISLKGYDSLLAIAEYLEKNYTTTCWSGR